MTSGVRSARRIPGSLWLAGAAASAGAGLIHLALGPAHAVELGALGLGFFLAAGLQLGWAALAVVAVLALRGRSQTGGVAFLVGSGIAINGAILAAWAVSRIVGLPAGEVPWSPESVGLSDAVAGVFEGSLVVGLVASLRGWRPSPAMRPRTRPLAGAAFAIALISIGTVVAIQPSEAAHTHAIVDADGPGDPNGAAVDALDAVAPRDAPADHHASDPEAAEVHSAH